jgi:trans-2-enoyl-CoA reductase
VLPFSPGFGTWREFAQCTPTEVLKISNDIPAEQAATVAVNPCTAYRLLEDLLPKEIPPNTWIIQNGATSAVGQAVIALAKHKGAHTINLIRNRPHLEETVQQLKSLGADYVFTEDSFSSSSTRTLLASIPKPILALNCVGGLSSAELARSLEKNGTLVTYGGMSRKPVQIPTGAFIFHNIKCVGFWLSKWNETASIDQRNEMLKNIIQLIREGVIKSEVEAIPFPRFADAMARVREPYRGKKIVLQFEHTRKPLLV